MTQLKQRMGLFVLGAAFLAFTGCHSHTTVVEPVQNQPAAQPAPQPDHHDDHRDDRHPPPPPPPDHRDDHR
jgi:hypothetical protein